VVPISTEQIKIKHVFIGCQNLFLLYSLDVSTRYVDVLGIIHFFKFFVTFNIEYALINYNRLSFHKTPLNLCLDFFSN
jgi:hypothetical protein